MRTAASLSFVKGEPTSRVARSASFACACIMASYLRGYLNGQPPPPPALPPLKKEQVPCTVLDDSRFCPCLSEAGLICTWTLLGLLECLGRGLWRVCIRNTQGLWVDLA